MTTELSSSLVTTQRGRPNPYPVSTGSDIRARTSSMDAVTPRQSPVDRVILSTESEEAKDINENPEAQRYSREKNQAREAFDRLIEELKIVRKVWANNPEELAAQLVRLGKELAKIVKQYQKAQQALADVLGKSSGSGLSVPSMSAPAQSANAPEVGDTTSSEVQETSEVAIKDQPVSDPARSDAFSAYQKAAGRRIRLDETPYAMELRGDIEFAGKARTFATKLREELEYGQKKAPSLPGHSKEREAFMKEAHKFLEDLEAGLFEYEGALKRAMPPAIHVTVPA